MYKILVLWKQKTKNMWKNFVTRHPKPKIVPMLIIWEQKAVKNRVKCVLLCMYSIIYSATMLISSKNQTSTPNVYTNVDLRILNQTLNTTKLNGLTPNDHLQILIYKTNQTGDFQLKLVGDSLFHLNLKLIFQGINGMTNFDWKCLFLSLK